MGHHHSQQNYSTKPGSEQGAGPLGNTYEICMTPQGQKGAVLPVKVADSGVQKVAHNWRTPGVDFRVARWALQAAAREVLPRSRINICLRMITPGKDDVEVWRHDETGRAHYKNLCTCGSVWTCAPCSSKITEGRRVELKAAIDRAADYNFYMVTFTLSHSKRDRLGPLVNDLLASYRRATSDKTYRAFAERSGIVGSVKALEVSYSDRNGFHPHLHILIVAKRGAKIDRRWLKAKWQKVIRGQGRTADYSIGCHFRAADYSAAEYVQKFGHERLENYWGASGELTKGAAKLARNARGLSMFQVLYNSLAAPTEKARAKWRGVFAEYAQAFKGKHHLHYSKGLRALLGLGVEKTDRELAEGGEHPSSLLATLSVRQWKIVLGNDARGEILAAAEKGLQAFEDFIREIGAMRIAGDDLQRRRVRALANAPRRSKPS